MKLFCKIENNVVISYPVIESNLKAAYADWDSDHPEKYNYKELVDNPPEVSPMQTYEKGNFSLKEDGTLSWDYAVIDVTTEDLVRQLIRGRRDLMLLASDWTQTVDAPLSAEKKTAWAEYRQALRDMPGLYPDLTFDTEIVWPVEP